MPAKKKKSSSAPKKKASSKAAPAKPAKRKKAPAAKKKAAVTKKVSAKKKAATGKKAPAKKKATASTKKKTGAAKKKTTRKTSSAKQTTNGKVPAPRGKRPAARAQGLNGHFPDEPVKPKVKPMNKRNLKKFKKILLELRERLQGDITFLTTDNLHRAGRETGADLSGAAQHSADHGTDNFDREFALSLASAEQDVMYEVDEALMRIEEGTYGICELTGVLIEPARLEVIPYTRYSVQAQAKMEQSRAGYRPFGQSFKKW